MKIEGYNQFGGYHSETGALRNILAYLGVVAPHTGEPFTEEMLLGIGGGIGATYFVYQFNQQPYLLLTLRYLAETYEGFLQATSARLGASANIKGTGSQKLAEANLKEALEGGRPPIAWVDLSKTPYFFQPDYLAGYFPDIVVVCDLDEAAGQALIDYRASTLLSLTLEELAAARASIRSQKNRTMVVEPPSQPASLKSAIEAGIRDCCNRMLAPRIKNLGLPALVKWADLVSNSKAKDGWVQAFQPGLHLYQALMAVYCAIEAGGTGGSAFRAMYARFLEEAQDVVGNPTLGEVAGQLQEAAALWSAVADAALPDAVDLFKEYKESVIRRDQVFQEQGASASSEIAMLNENLQALEAQATDAFPLNEQQANELLANLRDHILRVHGAEEKAISTLQRVVS